MDFVAAVVASALDALAWWKFTFTMYSWYSFVIVPFGLASNESLAIVSSRSISPCSSVVKPLRRGGVISSSMGMSTYR